MRMDVEPVAALILRKRHAGVETFIIGVRALRVKPERLL